MVGNIRRVTARLAMTLVASASLAACATVQPRYASETAPVPKRQGTYKVGKPYQVRGVWYSPAEDPTYDRQGVASWYGDAFHMKPTANGELFDMNAVTAAHTTLPLPSLVEVTNLENGRRLTVRVNDRGPFHGNRIIDLSRAAAAELGFERAGLAKVRVRYVGPAPLDPDGSRRIARYDPPPGRPPVQVAQPPPPAPTLVADVARATPAAGASIPPARHPPMRSAKVVRLSPAPVGGYRLQVAAFTDPIKARHAVNQLADTGPAIIEPVNQGGTVLYRVLMDAPADETETIAFQEILARFGFSDAKLVRAAGL